MDLPEVDAAASFETAETNLVDAPVDAPTTDPTDEGAQSPLANASMLMVSRLGEAALGWAGTVLIARTLGQEEFGKFSFIFSYLTLLSILTDMGVGRVALAGVLPEQPDRARMAGNYLILRFMLGLIGYVAACVFVVLLDYPSDVVRGVFIAGAVLVVATANDAWEIAFQARERLGPVAVTNVIGTLAQFALVLAIVLQGGTLLWLLIPAIGKELVIFFPRWRQARRLMPVRWAFHVPHWVAMMKEAIPLSIGALLQTAYWKVDSVMLSKMADFSDVGIYAVGYKFTDLAHTVPIALSTAIMAPLVRNWPDNLAGFKSAISRSGQVLMLLAGFAIVQMWLFAEPVIDLLYGDEYAVGAGAAQILVLSEAAGYIAVLAFTALVAAGRHAVYPIITLFGLAANIALNAALIPDHTFNGAAVATLATEFVVAVLLWIALLRVPGITDLGSLGIGKVLLAVAGTAVAGWLALAALPWLFALVLSVAVYFGLSAALGQIGEVRSFLAEGRA